MIRLGLVPSTVATPTPSYQYQGGLVAKVQLVGDGFFFHFPFFIFFDLHLLPFISFPITQFIIFLQLACLCPWDVSAIGCLKARKLVTSQLGVLRRALACLCPWDVSATVFEGGAPTLKNSLPLQLCIINLLKRNVLQKNGSV